MNHSKVLELLKSFIGGESVILNGIYLTPKEISNNNRQIFFDINNQNNVSYSYVALNEELKEILFDFEKYTTISLVPVIIGAEKVFISNELNNKIKNFFKSIKQIVAYDKYLFELTEIKGKSVDYYIETDDDRLIFWNKFIPHKGLVTRPIDETLITDNLVKTIENYYDFIEQDSSYWETENIYIKMDEILSDYPMLSPDWMATYYHTSFLNYT